MDTYSINAEIRAAGGKGDVRKARAKGATPGVMYRAGNEATAMAFDAKSLSAIFRKTNDPNTIVQVQMAGKVYPCLIREIQRNPLSRIVEHVDFHHVQAGERVNVRVAVTTSGRAAGVRAGGQLRVLARAVNLQCDAYQVPSAVNVDVTPLETGRFIRASQLDLPAGATIVFAQDFNVVTVEGKVKDEPVAAEAPVPGAKAAPPTAPGAKAAPAKAPAKK